MITITVEEPRILANISRSLAVLAANDLPVMTKVRVDRAVAAVRELERPWSARMDALIRRYRDDLAANEPASMSSNHEKYPEFSADPEVQDLLSEPVVVELQPVLLSEIVKADDRLDKRGKTLKLPNDFSVLIEMGFVRDDVDTTVS